MTNEYIEGIAGADIKPGQILVCGEDGKYYPIVSGSPAGSAAEPIKTGNVISMDKNGRWRPVNNPTK